MRRTTESPELTMSPGQWIRGHDEWNFGSERYFGDHGLEVQQSREVIIA